MKYQYDEGNRTKVFLKNYLIALSDNDRSIEIPFLEYYEKYPIVNDSDYLWIADIAKHFNSSSASFLVKNKKHYIKYIDFQNKINEIVINSAELAASFQDQKTYDELLKFIDKEGGVDAKKLNLLSSQMYSLANKNYEQYAENSYQLLQKFNVGDRKEILNNLNNCLSQKCQSFKEKIEKL